MESVIRLLSESVANQIAAGEVVQRPASVVKELLENSVDAGASEIVVVARDGGKELISVKDDGCGMSWSDAAMCFERHATSKISSSRDLESIATMGFRGEALASIAAVAEVTLETRREEEQIGSRIEVSGSEVRSHEALSCAPGACFTVRNLFFNVPGRRRFLKSHTVENRHLTNEFIRVSLAHPGMSFRLVLDDQVQYDLRPGTPHQRIISIFGSRLDGQLLPFQYESGAFRLTGFIGKPGVSRKRSGEQYFFVNQRYMRSGYLHRAVTAAYEHLMDSDRVPSYFIFVRVDPDRIDVNVHPAKTEIKFEDEQLLWQTLNGAVRDALGRNLGLAELTFTRNPFTEAPLPSFRSLEGGAPSLSSYAVPSHGVRSDASSAIGRAAVAVDWSDPLSWSIPTFPSALDGTKSASEPGAEEADGILSEMEAVAHDFGPEGPSTVQLFGRYILTPMGSGVALVDQHRAHYRVLYDQIERANGIQDVAIQPILIRTSVPLTPVQETGISQLVEQAGSVGVMLSYEPRSEAGAQARLFLDGLPVPLMHLNHREVLEELLSEYEMEEGVVGTHLRRRLLSRLTRHGAVRPGEPLSVDVQMDILHRLFMSSSPQVDPEGRRILRILTPPFLTHLIENF